MAGSVDPVGVVGGPVIAGPGAGGSLWLIKQNAAPDKESGVTAFRFAGRWKFYVECSKHIRRAFASHAVAAWLIQACSAMFNRSFF